MLYLRRLQLKLPYFSTLAKNYGAPIPWTLNLNINPFYFNILTWEFFKTKFVMIVPPLRLYSFHQHCHTDFHTLSTTINRSSEHYWRCCWAVDKSLYLRIAATTDVCPQRDFGWLIHHSATSTTMNQHGGNVHITLMACCYWSRSWSELSRSETQYMSCDSVYLQFNLRITNDRFCPD